MKILLSNASLLYKGGTELYTLSLANLLAEKGHEVVVYSPILGEVADMMKKIGGVVVTDDLCKLMEYKFDVLHIQHNINVWLLRSIFPKTPSLMMVHGILPDFEQPPKTNFGITKYIVVSNGVREHLIKNHGIKNSRIEIIHNWVDTSRFYPQNPINTKPKRLLVLSNHLKPDHKKIYEEVCRESGIKFMHIGLPNNSVTNVEKYINKVDIVVTVGRGAIESMACGRNVIVSDINGIDGLVTPENYKKLLKNNFSGHRYKRTLTKEIFKQELDLYSTEYPRDLMRLVSTYHDPQKNVEKILKIYEEIMNKDSIVDSYVSNVFFEIKMLVSEYSRKELYISYLNNILKQEERKNKELKNSINSLNEVIEEYKRTKVYKLASIYYKYRDMFTRFCQRR